MIWLDEGGRQRHARLIAPPPGLRGLVEHFWIHETFPKHVWRVVPDLSAYVILSTTRDNAVDVDCRVVGPRSSYCDIDVGGRELTIGARLAPGALPLFLHDSASQLRDQ